MVLGKKMNIQKETLFMICKQQCNISQAQQTAYSVEILLN